MSRASFIRRSLAGTALVAISLLTICGMAAASQRSTDAEVSQPTTSTEVTSTECTTTSTTTNSTTTSTTTAETTTVSKMVTTTTTTVWENTPAIETQPYVVEPQTETEVQSAGDLPINEQEYILLANVVSHEAGSSWIGTYEKSQIVAAIMNRVADPRFPNSIEEVIYQPNQVFPAPYYRVDYSGAGYEPIDAAIEMYFSGEYNYGSINSWYGTGTENVFYSI